MEEAWTNSGPLDGADVIYHFTFEVTAPGDKGKRNAKMGKDNVIEPEHARIQA